MPKGHLSWPGNSWIPFTFQPALQALQQPHKHSYSLQLAIHTRSASTLLHSKGFMISIFFLSPTGFLQSIAWSHQSTESALERATSHIKVTCPPCLFRLLSWENEAHSKCSTLFTYFLPPVFDHLQHQKKKYGGPGNFLICPYTEVSATWTAVFACMRVEHYEISAAK